LVQLYHGLKGDRHLWLHSLHQQYGSHVRVAPNFVSIRSIQALHEIYGYGKYFRKSDFYNAFPAIKGVYNTHNAIDKTLHGRKRRVLSHAFSDNALKGMEDLMLSHIRRFCDIVTGDQYDKASQPNGMKRSSAVWNFAEWFGYLTYDIMGELSFGKSFDMVVDSSKRRMVHLIDRAAHRHYAVGLLPLSLTLVFPSTFTFLLWFCGSKEGR
jgi:hypothetical protein